MDKMIEGVEITPLKRISHPKGDVFHALKATEKSFRGFGEAYFSSVNMSEKKGWKKHLKMTLNLVVPFGCIRFSLYDDRPGSKTIGGKMQITLSRENYKRLTVPPGIWVAFEGMAQENLLLNLADLTHNPDESVNVMESELFGKSGFADGRGEMWVE